MQGKKNTISSVFSLYVKMEMASLSMRMAGRKPCMILLTKAVCSWNNVLIWSFNKAHGFLFLFCYFNDQAKRIEETRNGILFFLVPETVNSHRGVIGDEVHISMRSDVSFNERKPEGRLV